MARWRAAVASACGWLAAVSLAVMMLITVADVVLRAAVNKPIRGTLEIVELLLDALRLSALFKVIDSLVKFADTLIEGARPAI